MNLIDKMFSHQIDAAQYALRLFGVTDGEQSSSGAALLMSMGTGKTLTAIAIAGALYEQGLIERILIVAPLSVLPVWEEEYKRFADYPYRLTILKGTPDKKRKQIDDAAGEGCRILVTNYESCWRLERELNDFGPHLIIADEGHKIKDGQAKQSKAMHRLGDRARYKLLLTGTVITNREVDVWSQYRFVNPDIFGRQFLLFRRTFFEMGGYQNHVPIFKEEMRDEFARRMHSIAYRVTTEEALDLPPYTDEIRPVELEADALRLYQDIERKSFAELKDSEVTAANVLTRLLRLLQITGGHITDDVGTIRTVSTAKLAALEDILDAAQAEGRKVAVIARFTAELDDIEAMLKRKHIGYAVIRGGTKERGQEVSRFQNDPECSVFLGQIACAGLGLTLTAASLMVFYSWDYSLANHDQARARIHRAGQNRSCHYIYLAARGTIDRRVIRALREKQDLAKAIVDEWRKGGMGLVPW